MRRLCDGSCGKCAFGGRGHGDGPRPEGGRRAGRRGRRRRGARERPVAGGPQLLREPEGEADPRRQRQRDVHLAERGGVRADPRAASHGGPLQPREGGPGTDGAPGPPHVPARVLPPHRTGAEVDAAGKCVLRIAGAAVHRPRGRSRHRSAAAGVRRRAGRQAERGRPRRHAQGQGIRAGGGGSHGVARRGAVRPRASGTEAGDGPVLERGLRRRARADRPRGCADLRADGGHARRDGPRRLRAGVPGAVLRRGHRGGTRRLDGGGHGQAGDDPGGGHLFDVFAAEL